MDLKALLPRHHILIGLKAKGRRKILEALATPLINDGMITNLEQFLDDLERREDQINTQIGRDMAIPHARSECVRRLSITVGLAAAPGLAFSNDPEKPVCRIFFLIAVPALAPTAHLNLLQHLVHFANDPRRLEKFRECRTAGPLASQLINYKWKP